MTWVRSTSHKQNITSWRTQVRAANIDHIMELQQLSFMSGGVDVAVTRSGPDLSNNASVWCTTLALDAQPKLDYVSMSQQVFQINAQNIIKTDL